MIELPTNKVAITQVNPDKLILFSSPKPGKTTALAMLENNLILDLEDGAGYVNALKINCTFADLVFEMNNHEPSKEFATKYCQNARNFYNTVLAFREEQLKAN